MSGDRPRRVLVACVGNILRGDDGFGIAVARQLRDDLLPPVDLIETGTAGLRIVQELLDGYDVLIIVDAIDRQAPPGSVFVLTPDVADPADLGFEAWREEIGNFHLAEPSRVLLLARAAGVLPPHVVVVGCQPAECGDFEQGLSSAVAEAVPVAARKVIDVVNQL